MAHTKAKGSTKLGRDSIAKRLGVKKFDGQIVKPGEVIIRQRGNKYYPGLNVKQGKDDTLYSLTKGRIKFSNKQKVRFDGKKKKIKVVSVLPLN